MRKVSSDPKKTEQIRWPMDLSEAQEEDRPNFAPVSTSDLVSNPVLICGVHSILTGKYWF